MPVDHTDDVTRTAEVFFGAMEKGDMATVNSLFAPDAVVWHSGDRRDLVRTEALAVISWFIDTTISRRYEILDRRMFEGGFAQQHILHATGSNGAAIAPRVCIIVVVNADGLIGRIDEYLETKDIAPLR